MYKIPDYFFFNPKAGLNFLLSDQQRAYLSVARANREPNRSNFVDADPAGPVPMQETLMDYEAGYGNNLIVKDVDLFDYAIAVIHSDSTLLNGESDTNLILTLSKTFSF